MNKLQAWLYLIGTPQRAAKLRRLLDRLDQGRMVSCNDVFFAQKVPCWQPATCPTQVLFGAKTSERLYLRSDIRPALDAWDVGELTKEDIRRLCYYVEQGKYTGQVYKP